MPQSPSTVQEFWQAVPAELQPYGAQDDVVFPQEPAPLQALRLSVPPVQVVPGQSPCGSLPSETLVQVPSAWPVSAVEQAWHFEPVQATLQQTPSAQNPEVH